MGSKRLKAVVVLGDRANMPKPVDEAAFRKADQAALEWLRKTPTTQPKTGGLHQFGTNVLMNLMSELGGLPTKNAQMTSFDHADDISGERVAETMLAERPTCHACPVACKKLVDVPGGKYKVRMESTEYESVWALGAQCLNNDLESIAFMIDRCNDYGMDTIEMGNTLAMAMEARDKGLVEEAIDWGDADRMIELIDQTANREGLGAFLALGTARAAEVFGAVGRRQSVATRQPGRPGVRHRVHRTVVSLGGARRLRKVAGIHSCRPRTTRARSRAQLRYE
jgi:aldehyde:ferredoxin oxidoreductase